MIHGSAFTGLGGFDLAFERAGVPTAWQIEIDDHCRDVLRRAWPDVEQHADIREVDARALPHVDIVSAGFPCQDVSVAGKRSGLHGERSGLFFDLIELLREVRPTWVLLENVPGLLTSQEGRDFGLVLSSLAEVGFHVAWRVLDARCFGVPQRRRRVFIVGHLGDERSAAEILLEPEGGCWNPDKSDEAGTPATGRVAARARKGRELLADTGVVSGLTSRMGTAGWSAEAAQAGWLIPFRKSQRAHHADDCETWDYADVSNTLDAEGNSTRTAHAVVAGIAYSIYPTSGQGSELAARETDIAPALSATDGKLHERGTRIASELGVRRLIPLECERLQGFPDGWTEGDVDTHRYRMLGNAVAVPVVEWIARRIMAQASMAQAETRTRRPRSRAAKGSVTHGPKVDLDGGRPAADPRGLAPHCAKFSDALLPKAREMLQSAGLKKYARVLDPFAGSGKGCEFLVTCGYRPVGIELEPEWADQSTNVEVGDALHLRFRAKSFDAVFTSPTYGTRMGDKDLRESVAGTYAKSLGRLASDGSSCHLQWHDGPSGNPYREFHEAAWREAHRVLRDGGLFLLNIKNHVRGKVEQQVSEWHVQCLKSLRFELIESEFVPTPSLRHGQNHESRVDGEWLHLFRKVGS